MPAAQFIYRKGLGSGDAMLTISHNLQESLDAGMEFDIVQLYFSAASDIVSDCGPFFKLKSNGVSVSVQSICSIPVRP